MKKEKWIKEANEAHNNVANSLFAIQNWVSLLEFALEKGKIEDSVVCVSRRTNKELYLSEVLETLNKNIDRCSKGHYAFAELSKGLLQVVSDDANIEPKSLFS